MDTPIQSNRTTRCNSLTSAPNSSLGARCAPIAFDTRMRASYRVSCNGAARTSEWLLMVCAPYEDFVDSVPCDASPGTIGATKRARYRKYGSATLAARLRARLSASYLTTTQ